MARKPPVAVKMLRNELPELHRRLAALSVPRVLAGFPAGDPKGNRDENPAMTNADIAYIQDNGDPGANIPARPFMRPGIEKVQEKMGTRMFAVARNTVRDGVDGLEDGLSRVGMEAVKGIKARINEGIPPPLADGTLAARARRGRKGAMWELAWRAAGAPAGTDLAKPLIDTGQLRNAVTYVIRRRKEA